MQHKSKSSMLMDCWYFKAVDLFVEKNIQPLLSHSTEDASKRRERLAFFFFCIKRRMSNDTAGFSQWGAGRKMLSSYFSLAFHESFTPRCGAWRLTRREVTHQAALPRVCPLTPTRQLARHSAKNISFACFSFPPPPEGFLLFKMFSAGAINPTPFHFSTDDSSLIRGACRGSAGANPGCLVGRRRGYTLDHGAM